MLHYFVKAGIILFYFLIFPMLAGMAFHKCCKRKQMFIGDCYIHGYLLMFVLGFLVFEPAIKLGMYFMHAVWLWLGVSIGVGAGFFVYLGGDILRTLQEWQKEIKTRTKGMTAVYLIFVLLCIFSVLVVVPEYNDNTAETILITQATNTMYKYNPYNSELYGGVPEGAPIVMFYAAVCRMTGMTIRKFVHNVLPVFLLPLFLAVYRRISRQLFHHREKDQAIFLFLVMVFYAASMYTVRLEDFGVFQNIWAPMALLYQVLLPYGISVCVSVMNRYMKQDMKKKWHYREAMEPVLLAVASQFVYHTGASMQIVIMIAAAVIICVRRIWRKCREL